MTRRIEQIKSSGIRKIFSKAANLKNVIDLSIGQPDFSVPEKVKEGIKKAIDENKTGYTSSDGINRLKQNVLEKHKGESVIITPGATAAIFLTFSAILEERDEMIVLEPYFVVYPDICKFLNAVPKIVETKKDFSIDLDKLEKSISKKTRAIMINTPNNPTGHVIDNIEMQKICEIAKKNDLWIISDEIYEDFDYEKKFVSALDHYDKVILISGFSKSMALTGERIGYAVGPKKIIDDMVKLQQYTFVCAPNIIQEAVAENIGIDISEQIDIFKKRRDYVYEKLKFDFDVVKPNGAFYYFIKLPEGINGEDFAEECLKKNLLLVPGDSFCEENGFIRISYAVKMENLEKGIGLMKEVLTMMKK